ncbi:1672_t:CDS:2, partial [Gigaspora margarita]
GIIKFLVLSGLNTSWHMGHTSISSFSSSSIGRLCGACSTMGGGLCGALRIPVVVYPKCQFVDYSRFDASFRHTAHQWMIIAAIPAYKFLSHGLRKVRNDQQHQYGVVLGKNFEIELFNYLKRHKLRPKRFTNNQIINGKLLHNSSTNNKEKFSLRIGNLKIMYSDDLKITQDGVIENLDFYRIGNFNIIDDDSTDIMCNWNGYPFLIQAKF